MTRLSFTVVAVWLTGIAVAFWLLEGRYTVPLQPGGQPPSHIRVPAEVNRRNSPTIIIAWDAGCQCSAFAEGEMTRIVEAAGGRADMVCIAVGNSFQAAQARFRGTALSQYRLIADPTFRIVRQLGLAGAPGAVVLDAAGAVRYRGGLNAARFCSAEETAFARHALSAVIENRKVQQAEGPIYGCRLPSSGP
jgi:hypothetical protein